MHLVLEISCCRAVIITNLRKCMYEPFTKVILFLQAPYMLHKYFYKLMPSPYVMNNIALQRTPIGLNVIYMCSIRRLVMLRMIYSSMFVVVVRYIAVGLPTV